MNEHLVPANSLSLAAARIVVAAAEAHATTLGIHACICVVDFGGDPIVSVRMDGAPRLSAGIALNKAWTVSQFSGMPTHLWWDAIKDEPSLVHGLTQVPRFTVFGGGVAVTIDGAMVGAIGVSGGSADQDREIAQAGAAAL
jgi:glc operon protein GlcG